MALNLTFEGKTNATNVSASPPTGLSSGDILVRGTSAACTYSSTQARGSISMKAVSGNNAARESAFSGFMKDVGASNDYMRGYFYIPSGQGTFTTFVMGCYDAADNDLFHGVVVKSDGTIQVTYLTFFDNGGGGGLYETVGYYGAAGVFTFDTWNRLELYMANGQYPTVKSYIGANRDGGTPTETFVDSFHLASRASTQIAAGSAAVSSNITVYVDDFATGSTWLGASAAAATRKGWGVIR